MKKKFKITLFSLIAIISLLATSLTCFAADSYHNVFPTIPQSIDFDGGHLELIGPESGLSTSNGILRYQYHVVTDGGNLNVRSGPGLNYSVIGKFANGQVIEVSFMQEANIYPWVYAGGNNIVTNTWINGYIHSDYYR